MTSPRPWLGSSPGKRQRLQSEFRHVVDTWSNYTYDREALGDWGTEQVEAFVRWYLSAMELATARLALDEANRTLADARPEDAAQHGLDPEQYRYALVRHCNTAQAHWDHWFGERREADLAAARVGVLTSEFNQPGPRPPDAGSGEPAGPRAAFRQV